MRSTAQAELLSSRASGFTSPPQSVRRHSITRRCQFRLESIMIQANPFCNASGLARASAFQTHALIFKGFIVCMVSNFPRATPSLSRVFCRRPFRASFVAQT
eukprot:3890794-Pleurochrysis_carterae.AAC.1